MSHDDARSRAEQNDDKQKAADESHTGFTGTCQECQSTVVYVTSDVGFSDISGAWGGVLLRCADCDNETEIWSAG